jgi:hypothetical protein
VAEVGGSVLAVGATRCGAGLRKRSRSAESRFVPGRSVVAGGFAKREGGAAARRAGRGAAAAADQVPDGLTQGTLPDQVAGSGRCHGGQRREPCTPRASLSHTPQPLACRNPPSRFSPSNGRTDGGRRPFRAPLTCRPPGWAPIPPSEARPRDAATGRKQRYSRLARSPATIV